MGLFKGAILALMAAMVPAVASAQGARITSNAQLIEALAGAHGGERLELAPGHYGALVLDGRKMSSAPWDRPVTLESENPEDPAVFNAITLVGVKNISFSKVHVDYKCTSGDALERPLVSVTDADTINFSQIVLKGDFGCNGTPGADGYGAGIGLKVLGSRNIAVLDSHFTRLMRGAIFGRVTNLVVSRNTVSEISSDGFDFADVDDVLIESNSLKNFSRSLLSSDHPDMIQFWTRGTTSPSTNITIRNNFLNCGAGGCGRGRETQSIFMRNEQAELDGLSEMMFYKNIVIEGNVIRNAHTHGITVGETNGLVVRNNTLIQAHPVDAKGTVSIPSINIVVKSHPVTVQDNITSGLSRIVTTPRKGWTVTGNRIVQWEAKAGTPHLAAVFVNPQAADPDLSDLAVNDGVGIAAMGGVGSPLLYPEATQLPPAVPAGQN